MRLVQQANQRPFRCAVIPFMGNSKASGFIDTGMFLGDDKVYISFEGGVEIAKAMGWVGPSARRVLEAENAELRSRIEQVEAELAEADRYRESVDYLSNHGQLKPYKKPGRPKKEPANA